jgi:putative heme-binding domain-containing protein
MVRVHAMRVLSETPKWNESERALAVAGLQDADAMVQRCAADALGQHPRIENVRPLLDAREKAPAADKHLVHTLRMALRNQLNDESVAAKLPLPGSSDEDSRALLDVAAGATSAGSTMLVVRQIGSAPVDPQNLADSFRHVGRFGSDANAEELATICEDKFANDSSLQLSLLVAMQEGIAQRNGSPGEKTRAWAKRLVQQVMASPGESFGGWTRFSLDGKIAEKEIWAVQDRKSADKAAAPFISSLPLGETNTGTIRSRPFAVPAKLTFYMAGHNGFPTAKSTDKNVIRLRAADSNEILAESFPPRNDTAQKVSWNLAKFAGRNACIEATDGDDRTAYAWLAFGRFEPAVIHVPSAAEIHRLQTAIDIIRTLHMGEFEGQVAFVLTDKASDNDAKIAAVKTLAELDANQPTHLKAMAALLIDPAAPDSLREAIGAALQRDTSAQTSAAYIEALRTAPQKLQLSLARNLVTTAEGAAALLQGITAGKASPRLLQDANVLERLKLSHMPDLDAQIAKLTANLPPADQAVQALIDSRAKSFNRSRASAERGQKVFQQTCAACHSIGGIGARVGPQLDGIGIRGVARLAEDILDPSRNVDAAFRYNSYQLDSGDVVAGIPRREEGDVITVADSTGKEIPIARSKVKRVVPSNLSLMPSNFGEVIKPADFDDLMSYLLSTAAASHPQ